MAKKIKREETKTEVKRVTTEGETPERGVKTQQVKALEFMRLLDLEWVLDSGLDEGDIAILNAQVTTDKNGHEWVNWFMPYKKVDGAEVPGIGWGISAPIQGRFLILRLVEGREVKATLKVWSSGKGIITGSEPVVKALTSRPDLPPWTDEDTASLL